MGASSQDTWQFQTFFPCVSASNPRLDGGAAPRLGCCAATAQRGHHCCRSGCCKRSLQDMIVCGGSVPLGGTAAAALGCCLSMRRFISKRSSSSVDLDSSSFGDVRTERDSIAVSVGLSWPPGTRCRSAGRSSWRQHWERALQEHILHHYELPHVSAYSSRAGGNEETLFPARSLTSRSPTSALQAPWPPQPLHSLKSPAAPVRSAAKSTSTQSPATGSSTCWTSGGESGDGTCSGACARSSVCAPGCSTGSTRTLPVAGSGARHEQRRAAGQACCHPQT